MTAKVISLEECRRPRTRRRLRLRHPLWRTYVSAMLAMIVLLVAILYIGDELARIVTAVLIH